jgi:hypothetical protein
MNRRSRLADIGLLGVSAAMFLPLAAQANDSTAVMGAGGIELTVSKDVVMESEDLRISERLVQVRYQFRNTGPVEVKTKVAFPVPAIPLCEDDCAGDLPIGDGPNPMDFKLKVDGKSVAFKTARKQTGKGDNRELLITHYWEQIFPKDRPVAIEHEYRPAAGGSFLGPGIDFKQESKEYCLGEKLLRNLARSERVYREIHYILTTGANWKGPIGHFKLTLLKTSPRDVISTCISDTRRVSDTAFEVVRENFTPTEDLKILFVPGKN